MQKIFKALQYPVAKRFIRIIEDELEKIRGKLAQVPEEHRRSAFKMLDTQKLSPKFVDEIESLVFKDSTIYEAMSSREILWKSIKIINNPGPINKKLSTTDYEDFFKPNYDLIPEVDPEHFLVWKDKDLQALCAFAHRNSSSFAKGQNPTHILNHLGYVDKKRAFLGYNVTRTEMAACDKYAQANKSLILGGTAPPSLVEARDFIYRAFEFGSLELKQYIIDSVLKNYAPQNTPPED